MTFTEEQSKNTTVFHCVTASIVACCGLHLGDFPSGVTRRSEGNFSTKQRGAQQREKRWQSTQDHRDPAKWSVEMALWRRFPRVSFALFFFRALLPYVKHLQRRLSTHSPYPYHTKSPAKATLHPAGLFPRTFDRLVATFLFTAFSARSVAARKAKASFHRSKSFGRFKIGDSRKYRIFRLRPGARYSDSRWAVVN